MFMSQLVRSCCDSISKDNVRDEKKDFLNYFFVKKCSSNITRIDPPFSLFLRPHFLSCGI